MNTIVVKIGSIKIGGENPIAIQSMVKSSSTNLKAVIAEIKELEKVGCEIVRLAIPNSAAAKNISIIKKKTTIPLVADIHFDYKLALLSIKLGADKIRINPGNISARYKVQEIIKVAQDKNIPIRIGVNAGSIPKEMILKYQRPTVQALLDTLKRNLEIFETANFTNLVLSAKTTNPIETIEIYEKLAHLYPYPLHIGVTEAGLPFEGVIRSTTALSILLKQGIGNTIRVSLTGPSVLEVKAAQTILSSLDKRQFGPILISCPTCGRCQVDLIKIAEEVNQQIQDIKKPIKIAVMGCVVNGPLEAKTADYGIACGKKSGVLFKSGRVIKKSAEQNLVNELIKLIKEN